MRFALADVRRWDGDKIFNANEEGMGRKCPQMACSEYPSPTEHSPPFTFYLPTFYRAERRPTFYLLLPLWH
jgi:hypothetical protein